jgi:SAM-dependent methyltransferase
MPESSFIDRQLRQQAIVRFKQFAPLPLQNLNSPSPAFVTLPDPVVEFMARYRDAVWRWLGGESTGSDAHIREDALRFFVDNMLDVVLSKNQFLTIGQEENHDLAGMYRHFLLDFRNALLVSSHGDEISQALSQVLSAHQSDLAAFVNELAGSNGSSSFVFREATCAEYAPELQLGILHALPEGMMEPILDLGCGPGAALVHYLRRQGKVAFGIDRMAEASRFVARADWLEYPLGAGRWGTVISHMALSNHFLHHHLRPDGHPERYAQRYMEVLHSLKPGGSFFYAPGLPFFEELLPADRYPLEKFPIPDLADNPAAGLLQDAWGMAVLYACRAINLQNV